MDKSEYGGGHGFNKQLLHETLLGKKNVCPMCGFRITENDSGFCKVCESRYSGKNVIVGL